MDLKLSEGLTPDPFQLRFSNDGFVTVADFLHKDVAEELFWAIYRQIHWDMVYPEKGMRARVPYEELTNSDPAKVQDIRNRVLLNANKGGQYLYYAKDLANAESKTGAKNLTVQDIEGFLASKPFLEFLGGVIGCDHPALGSSEASLFQGYSFLSTRKGSDIEKDAIAFFTLDMTKEWYPYWGGYLQLPDPGGNIDKAFFPVFNTLHIVPASTPFSISYVPPFCNGARLAISGVVKKA